MGRNKDDVEYSLALSKSLRDGRISAVVRMSDSVPLREQIAVLHGKDPSEGIESIKAKLKVKEWRLDENSCPAVKRSYDEFRKLSLPLSFPSDRGESGKAGDDIETALTSYTFRAYVSGGEMVLVLYEREHPFVRWALRARDDLERCTAGKTAR